MYILQIIFILLLSVTISCSKEGPGDVSLSDDVLYSHLEQELQGFEGDHERLTEYIVEARARIQGLTISPKMYDIAKKDLISKERFAQQAGQRIDYLKIKLNNRKKFFMENQYRLTKELLQKDLDKYLIDQAANPITYPWRQAFQGGTYKPQGKGGGGGGDNKKNKKKH